ncbi:hypothetical protein [Streptomyces sp. NPDC050856]|uniref:hypothetical protein n=1 Tax=Streptomyces sp. NPDC050856 TaxID=3154939 RepID=UPI0033C79558
MGRSFDYILTSSNGGAAAVAGRAEADTELAFVLLRLSEDIIWPVTAANGEADPCADSFALDEVGYVLLSALRDWARDSRTTGSAGHRPRHHPVHGNDVVNESRRGP